MIPDLYAHITLLWSGVAAPLGAATTFGVYNNLDRNVSEIGAYVQDAFNTSGIKALLPNILVQSEILIKKGPTATGPSGTYAGGGVGGSSAAPATPQVAILVQKQTEFGGRSGKGRLYFPGVQEASVNGDGALITGYRNDWQTAVANFRTKLDTNDLPMVVFHRPGAPLTVPSIVSALSVQAKVATQRRRNRK